MPPAQFAFSGVTRKTDETYESVRSRAPGLAAAALSAFAAEDAYVADGDVAPLEVPFRLGPLRLAGRRVRLVDAPGASAPPVSTAGPADLAVSVPVATPQGALAALRRLAAVKTTARAVTVAGASRIQPVVAAIAAGPADLLILDIADVDAASGAVVAARAAWPDARLLGVRIRPTAEPECVLPALRDLIAQGCSLVSVADAPTSDLIRQALKVPTICEGPWSRQAAETLLVSGRADLVEVS
jgi:hypothetical protein